MHSLFYLLVGLALAPATFATHVVGGYIQTRSLFNQGLTQEISVTMYLSLGPGSQPLIQPTIFLCLGDGNVLEVQRVSVAQSPIDKAVTINLYRLMYTYGGPGTYSIQASAVNRTDNVRNIDNGKSVSQAFALRTAVQVGLTNQTPTLTLPATGLTANAGVGLTVPLNQPVSLSLAAIDPDGDSLSYALTTPLTSRELTVPATAQFCTSFSAINTYQFPNDIKRIGTYRLNSRTGQLDWNVPTEQGQYSIALIVSEWRRGVNISQTQQELMLTVIDQGGTPTTPPAYEPAQTLGVITAVAPTDRDDFKLTVSPNPVTDDVMIVQLNAIRPCMATLQLLDGQGRVQQAARLTYPATMHRHTFDLRDIPAGLYFIRAESNGRQVVSKVLRQ